MMLVLSVKVGQRMTVNGVEVVVLDRKSQTIKLGFDGPEELKVIRHDAKRKEKAA